MQVILYIHIYKFPTNIMDKIDTIITSADLCGLWFSYEEVKFLNDWYDYYVDLLNGDIKPESVIQKTFSNIFNQKIKTSREPIKYHSKVYQELSLTQKTFVRY